MVKFIERFWKRVRKLGGEDACWLWGGSIDNKGYGRLNFKGRSLRAHRVSYELHKGRIPAALVLDHRCRNRWCVNPKHLEPVTVRENTLRGESVAAQRARATHCPLGHALGGDNIYVRPDRNGRTRECKQCKRRHAKESSARMRASVSFPYGALSEEDEERETA